MAISKEIQKSSDMKFDGKLIKVTYDIADVNGQEAWREVVHHPGATAIVAITDEGKIVMERQFRYALDRALLEIPAGKLDPNESPLNCAKRELAEETGYRAEEWISLGTICTSPGFCDEILHLYLAKGLTAGETHWDPDEYVELEYMTLEEVLAAIGQEEVKDAKSLAALMLALPHLQTLNK
ncbi:MAG: NUDIX hydrolase [Veillonella sp.]|nr:NUDIX hydrolase [Veillonella sp.]